MDATELVQEYFRRTNKYRSDLNALAEFVEERDSDGFVDSLKLIKLFWHTFRPSAASTDSDGSLDGVDEETQPLPNDLETAFLEQLADLERECRIPYVPDSDDLPDFSSASQYIYLGGASALRHRQRDGFSEYVRDTLNKVWRLLRIVERQRYIEFGFPLLKGRLSPWETVSLYGAVGLVLTEIFHVKYLDGDYDGALPVAADVLWSLGYVEEAYPYSPTSPAEFRRLVQTISKARGEASGLSNDVIDEEEEKRYQVESEICETVRERCPSQGLTPQQMVDAFEGLKMRGKSQNWDRVVSVCERVVRGGGYPFGDGIDFSEDNSLLAEVVTSEEGIEEPWILYWRGAEAWAEAQMGQNELRDFLRQQERDASEKRLVGYFFGETWRDMPEKAREHLVNADYLWFTNARGVAFDAVLNDLQVAAETICYDFIWEPLRRAKGGQELLEFKKRDNDLSQNHRFPTLSDYAWVCGQPFFKAFVQGLGLNEEEQLFLTADLENHLDFLRRGRDIAQHDPNARLRREDVERLVHLFFGIGQPGVLRRLAEIGPKLAAK